MTSASVPPKGRSGFTAEEIVGWNHPADNLSIEAGRFEAAHIAPLEAFGEDAGPLVKCLESEPVRAAFAAYDRYDNTAIAAQTRYRQHASWILIPTFCALGLSLLLLVPPAWIGAEVAAVCKPRGAAAWQYGLTLLFALLAFATVISGMIGLWRGATLAKRWYGWAAVLAVPTAGLGTLLYLAPAWSGALLAAWCGSGALDAGVVEGAWRLVLPWTIYGLLILSLLSSLILRPNRYHETWHNQRGAAEAMRREIFHRIMHTVPEGTRSNHPWLLQLKLEHFRRWQVEVQKAYFERRHRELKARVRKVHWAQVGYGVMLVLLFALLLLSFVLGRDEHGYSGWPGVVTAIAAHLTFLEAIHADLWVLFALVIALLAALYLWYQARLASAVRNVPRYQNMAENYKSVMGERLAAARKAAAAGDEASVREYVDRVHAMMSLETNDWIRLGQLDEGKEQTGPIAAAARPSTS